MTRKFITLSEEISDPRFGKYPSARNIDEKIRKGIVLIDKPSGPTSHQVITWIKDMLDLSKAGHSGTLDPKTTGMLLVALEKATKVMPVLKGMDKEYITVMKLHSDVKRPLLEKVAEDYRGEIKQIPPKKSAVKRRERIREIKELEIIEKDGKNVLMRVRCEAGTYIRKLIHDMGQDLGCRAHMAELRRTSIGPYTENQLIPLNDLKDYYVFYNDDKSDILLNHLRPVEMLADLTKVIIVKDTAVEAICNGAPLGIGGISKVEEGINEGDYVSMLSLKGELIAIGKSEMTTEDIINNERGKAIDLKNVIMERGTYPKGW